MRSSKDRISLSGQYTQKRKQPIKLFYKKVFKNFNYGYIDTYFISFILVLSFIWSLFLLSEWGYDFGLYYTTTRFLGDDFQLYRQAFTHKGPVYYLFLKGIGSLLGWGATQAYISLSLTVSFFLLSVFYVAKFHVKNNLMIVFIVGLSFASLFQQPSNASIAIFQSALLLLFFHAIATYSQKNTTFYLALSIVLLCLSILTRIDSIIYLLLFLPLGFLLWKRGVKPRKIIFGLALGIIISIVICIMISKYLNISVALYYLHNVDFNRWYKPAFSLRLIHRPEHLKLLMASGLILTVIITLSSLLFHKGQKLSLSGIRNILTQQDVISIMILLLSVLAWIFAMTDKNYHVFILVPGMLFFIIYNMHVSEKSISQLRHYFIVSLLIICSYTLVPSIKTLIQKDNLFSPFDDYSDAKRYELTIEGMRSQSTAYIVGGRGWPYLFSGTKPAVAINNWWLYSQPEPFTTQQSMKDHNKLINSPNGYEFWIDNMLLEKKDTSPLFKEILKVSKLISTDGYYTKFSILK